ncbi:poltergeist like 1 isoform X2 [Tasmannia lanceolata]|uniref:poltergeist like 1 isoform X2 n=1 Tax=Tasmannia lanceolata TaxID=3420 RepID=UPI004063EA42
MGSGFSHLVLPSCLKTASPNNQPDLIFSSEPLDETLGHSFCYVRSSARFLSPSHSDRLVSPSQSLRLTGTETAFKSISGASVGANTSTPRTVIQPDVIYHNATDTLPKFNSSLFESTSSFMSGPIERGALSGPLDSDNGRIHFSAPLGGIYKKKGKGFSRVRKAFSRSFSEKKRPWVVPVFNFIRGKEETLDSDVKIEGEFNKNVQWAHGKAGEDRVHVVVSEDHGWLFVGIYDGFNGPDAPEFLMGNLYRAVYNELEGLFWEAEDCSLVVGEKENRNENLENVVETKDLPPPLSSGSVKRVTFQSEQMDLRRRKTLWEFLAEGDDDDELDLSGSDRFAFSVDNAFRVNNSSSGLRRRSVLFSKLKYGFTRHKETQRKLFPWRYDWEDKEKTEVENRVEERLQQNFRKCKVGPVDHGMVLGALSKALEVTELAYLDMTDKVLDRNPELALMGSCLLAVLMKDEDVYVMNVGDSRAIVAQYQPQTVDCSVEIKGGGNDGSNVEGIVEETSELGERTNQVAIGAPTQIMNLTALQLSTDHSTSIEEEVLRIKEEHPDDSQCIVNDRVKGRLKVTRAFGAGFLKQME